MTTKLKVYVSYFRFTNCSFVILMISAKPCIRRKFPNFSLLQVSEKFVFRSSEIFRKQLRFFELAKILRKKFRNNFLFLGQKIWKIFGKSSEKLGNRVFRTFGIYGNFRNCSIPNYPKIMKK